MASPSRPVAAMRGRVQATRTQPGTTKSSGQMTTIASAGTIHAAARAPARPAASAPPATLPRMTRAATVGARSEAVIGAG